jgi:translocation and assembly module TamB
MRYLKFLFYKLLFLCILLTFFFAFLLTTSSGLYLTTKLAKIILPGEIYIENPRGRLIDDFSFSKLHYKNEKIELNLTKLNLKWRWNALLHHQLFVENLQASDLEIISKNKEETKEKSSFNFPKLPLDITLNKVEIDKIKIVDRDSLITQLNHLELQAKLSNKLWVISKLNFNLNNMDFALQATSQPVLPYALTAKLQFKFINKFGQDIKGFADVGGDLSLYHWHAELSNPGNVVLNGILRDGQELHSLLSWQQFIWPLDKNKSFASKDGAIRIDGKIPDLTINLAATTTAPFAANLGLNAQTSKQSFRSNAEIKLPQGYLSVNLAYDELKIPKIQGKIDAKFSDLKDLEIPIQQLKFHSEFSGDSPELLTVNSELNADYFGNLLQGSVNYQKQQLKGKFSLGKNQFLLSGSPPYHWQIKATIPEPKLLDPQLKNLQTNLIANATITSKNTGVATLAIQPGSYQLADASFLQFSGGQIRAELNPKKLQIDGQLTIDQNKSLELALALPKFQLDKGLSDSQKIQGSLNLKVNSLSFLENFSPDISKIEGQINAVLKASGTLAKPLLTGNLSLNKAMLTMPQLGLDLNPIQLRLQSQDKHWELKGTIGSQGQNLNLSGQGNFAPKTTGTIHVEATNFPLIKTEEYLINVSPQLVLTISPNSLDLSGKILVPNAQIKPQTFTDTVSLSSDAVLVSTKPSSPPNPLHINTDISIEMGNEVALNVKGLQGFLVGTIHLRQLPQGPLNASGQLTVRDGKYKAYGQDLTIDQGELLFTGGLIDNPGINLRASRNFNNSNSSLASKSQLLDFNSANTQALNFGENTTVGILVTGRIKSPRIELFSEPSTLSQADILSMLILGKPANQANKAGGQLLLKAITSMNLGSSSRGLQLLEQLKSTLGLDIDLKTSSKLDLQTKQISDSNSVVVGKSLTKRIYLSYNFGLAKTDSNVVTLTYLLNKFFSIQINTSVTASSIDLLYTHKKENSK